MHPLSAWWPVETRCSTRGCVISVCSARCAEKRFTRLCPAVAPALRWPMLDNDMPAPRREA